ncbi:hypothetical protein A5906_31925 [Bradyrhizobium sacchari]|uniref:Membrane-bound lysozyme inhibitor of c-type lysozyme MliC n=1 Tax=Bradyrhizobium sacchari TaxID=1399419 RepID=A0A560JNI5_9BRAD|nr:hypothetical protein [Bradyrhizobium sacchari]OPY98246.1 hypothetical protein A5906_31925 [Bradyrhizobium sacchari]TWB56747.1 hypothetical protein FBZ94_1063 [Bradyrhizobium sacchari]TWB71024.1 hypothetical protein FBZ95_1073 [Bradyrhizobium sacchari]
MRNLMVKSLTAAILVGAGLTGHPGAATAADMALRASPSAVGSCSELVFTCENGRQYPLCPIAVSVAGEVVTASLRTGHAGGVHVRLVPMGVGYRYAGPGVWVDGFRGNALMNFGKHSQIACTIEGY